MLTVGVDEALDVDEVREIRRPEKIALEGKKVIAFYCNPYAYLMDSIPESDEWQ